MSITHGNSLFIAIATYCSRNHALTCFIRTLQEGNRSRTGDTCTQILIHIIQAVTNTINLIL